MRVSQERSELLDVLVVDVSNGCLGDWSWGIDVLFVHLGAIQRLRAVKYIIDRAQIVIRGIYLLQLGSCDESMLKEERKFKGEVVELRGNNSFGINLLLSHPQKVEECSSAELIERHVIINA